MWPIAAGLAVADTAASIMFCERLFEPWLDANPLLSNARHVAGSPWINFPSVSNEHWSCGNIVLMGDAAHSAHFSIGSGTKLALEDAIALARTLRTETDVPTALAAYEAERRIDVLRIQSAARNSTEWFENVPRYAGLPPQQFAYSLLTRSQRISHENLRLRDNTYLDGVERWLAEQATGRALNHTVPPMFLPFRLRDLKLMNRVVVSPMATYSASDGTPNDFHLVHLGGGEYLAAQDHALRAHHVQLARDQRIGAHAGKQVEEDFRKAELRAFLRDDRVHGHGGFEPAAQRVPLYQADRM